MKHIQTIENLFNKAFKEYEKTGDLGEATLNGRMTYSNFPTYSKGELREKYNVTIMDVEGKPRLYLRHWGTTTLAIKLDTKEILKFYGESVSDRNSMNTILYLLDISGGFRYFPSRDDFIYEVENETYYSAV